MTLTLLVSSVVLQPYVAVNISLFDWDGNSYLHINYIYIGFSAICH